MPITTYTLSQLTQCGKLYFSRVCEATVCTGTCNRGYTGCRCPRTPEAHELISITRPLAEELQFLEETGRETGTNAVVCYILQTATAKR